MKHILNDLTEQEKNAIREQHTGGMNVVTENFHKLLGSKLGDSKPLTEQTTMIGKAAGKAASAITGQGKPAPQNQTGNDRISNLAAIMKSIQTKQVPQQVIVNPSSKVNGMPWKDYVTKFKITPQEMEQANALLVKMGQTNPLKGGATVGTTGGATGGGKLPTAAKPTGGGKPMPGVSPTQVKSGSSMQNEQVMQTLKNVAMKGVDYAKKGLNMIQGKTGNKFFDAAISAKLGTMQDGKSSNEKVFCMDDSCEDSLRVFSDGRVVYERAEFNTKKKGKMALNSDNSFVIKFDDGTSSPKLMPK